MSAFYVWPLTYKQKLPLYFFWCNYLWPPHLSFIFLVFFLFLPLCFCLLSIFWSILFLSIHFSAFFLSPLFFLPLVPLAVIWIWNMFIHILNYTYISIYYFLHIIREEFFPIPKDSFHIQTALLAKQTPNFFTTLLIPSHKGGVTLTGPFGKRIKHVYPRPS